MANSTKSTSSRTKAVRKDRAAGSNNSSRDENGASLETATGRSLSSRPAQELPKWTFLTNHAHVLATLYANPDCIVRQVAWEVGITERAVQRIIQELEEDGFIERERVGRRNRYKVLTEQPLRHPIESHRNIGDLLRLVSG